MSRHAAALAAITVASLGCLPEPKPVVGKHVLVERDIGYLTFSRGPDGEAGEDAVYVKQKPTHGPVQAGPWQSGYPADLFVVGTGGGERRLLMEDIQPLLAAPFAWDARRRLIIEQLQPPPELQRYLVFGVDMATGQIDQLGTDIGGAGDFELSPSGRWAVLRSDRRAVSIDGVEIPLANTIFIQFVRDSLYVVDENDNLVRVDLDGSMTVIAAGLSGASWGVTPLATGDLLVLARYSSAGSTAEWRLLGTDHAGVLPVDAQLTGAVSPDGRRVVYHRIEPGERGLYGKVEVHVLTPDETPPEQMWQMPPARGSFGTSYAPIWRPGTDELWAIDDSLYPDLYPVVLRRGEAPLVVERAALNFRVTDASSPGPPVQDLFAPWFDPAFGQLFIDGGRWWVSKDPDDHAVIRLSDASNPNDGGGIVLASAGQGINQVAVLETGKRLAFMLGSGEQPDNLATVDAVTGEVRIVATHVAQAAYGTGRILARSGASQGGDLSRLSLFDLTTGAESIIAENVAKMVVARPCATCLALDPGARLLFTIQARYPFERDGIWLGVLQ